MAERKRRGLGRGLGALINSDGNNQSDGEGPTTSVPAMTPEVEAVPVDVSRETERSERPIDVFFSAKSHLETQRVSRETTAPGTRPRQRAGTTAPRRANGSRRAEMPDVLGSQSQTRESHTNQAVDHVPDGPDVSTTENEAVGVSRETPTVVDGAEFKAVPVASIQPNPRQPRQVFDEEEMNELVHSVREIGVLQPIVVRPLEGDRYELIMGERRWRASQAAGQQTVPAVVRSTSDENLLRDALLENIHRSQLNPLEEAGAYRQLLDDFGISQEELSRRIGRSRPQISNTLRLMNLPPAAQRRVAAGVLSSGHARALLSLENEEQMEDLAQRIIAEGLSVRGAEEAASLVKRQHQDEGVSRETNRLPSSGRVQHLDEYAEALTDRLDTQVKISLGAKKGRIAIDFASMEDLNRIMQLLGSEPQ